MLTRSTHASVYINAMIKSWIWLFPHQSPVWRMVTVNGYPIECPDPIEKGQFIFHLGDATDQLALVVKNLPANAGDARVACLISGWWKSPGEGNDTHSDIPAWEILWTEEPGRLQSMGLQRVRHDSTHTHIDQLSLLVLFLDLMLDDRDIFNSFTIYPIIKALAIN